MGRREDVDALCVGVRGRAGYELEEPRSCGFWEGEAGASEGRRVAAMGTLGEEIVVVKRGGCGGPVTSEAESGANSGTRDEAVANEAGECGTTVE